MKRNSTITKKKFLLGFLVITLFLALIRVIVPSVAETRVILRNNNVKHKLVVATKSTDSVKSNISQLQEKSHSLISSTLMVLQRKIGYWV